MLSMLLFKSTRGINGYAIGWIITN